MWPLAAWWLRDRAGRERDLMTTGSSLVALKPPAIVQPMFVAIDMRTVEPHSPTSLVQNHLTSLLGAVVPLKLRHRTAFLELDSSA